MKENIICTEDDKDFTLYKDKVNDRKVKFKIKDIFKDHWNNFVDKYKNITIRDVVFKNVNKILKCKTFSLGYTEYECPNCHKSLVVPNTCKSRFCSSCGYKYKNDRVENILQTAYNCNHRQIVFTIPEQLRKYFFFPFEDRINLLFKTK